MKLKGKFELIEFSVPADESVKIAEDFAIGFLNWYFDKGQWITKNLDVKGLLEIYKKHKTL